MEKTKARVLIVDNEKIVVDHVIAVLKHVVGERAELQCVTAGSGKECLELLASGTFDLIILDLNMEPMSGAEVIVLVDPEYRSKIVVLSDYLADHGEDERRSWMAKGIRDLWSKPITEARARLMMEDLNLIRPRVSTREELDDNGLEAIIGRGDAMRMLLTTVLRVADTPFTILIRGESGTGKELVAEAIHRKSSRSERAFVKVNCAAFARELFNSEFFGHVRGAFTGAIVERGGILRSADGGTLFLDEIGDMQLEAQAKILRVIETGEFYRVGEDRPQNVGVRLIAATNQDLEAKVTRGEFREDLYYRLNGHQIWTPPLREHSEDIDELATRFIENMAVVLSRPAPTLTEGARTRLHMHSWPGNVRELNHLCEKLVLMGAENGEITAMHVKRLLHNLTHENPNLSKEDGASDSTPVDSPRDLKSERQNGAEYSKTNLVEERVPRKPIVELTVDHLIVAVIVFGCNYTALADYLGLAETRPDQTIGRALRKNNVFETIASRFRISTLHLASMAKSCMVTEGELLPALRSDKFCKAVNDHLNFEDHFREVGQAGEAAIVEFVNKVGTPYMRDLATSVGIGIPRRSRKKGATN